MCGIAGIVHFDRKPVDPLVLKRVSDALRHRGPDGEGSFCQGPVGIAHRRLAIIDPHAGLQPFYSDDRDLVLSYNGEVYNYREIRAELSSEFEFRTESDTEVVLRAYQKWGIDCLARFRGMFAFALFDAKKRRLYLVRDRVGIKPLYCARHGARLAFASELTALLELDWVPREVDRQALAAYLRYIYIPSPATIYRDIRKLEPGHYLELDIDSGRAVARQYWELGVRADQRTEESWLEELNATLDDVLRKYIRSDVPFGAFLSGGVDSSLVTALMARQMNEPVRTYSIGFEEPRYSELSFAAAAAAAIHTRHHEKTVSSQLAVDLLRDMARHFGEPFADSSAVPTFYVAREAARDVKMVLSGDGGDELFGGYNSYTTAFRMMHPKSGLSATGLRRVLDFLGSLGSKANATATAADLQKAHDNARTQFDDETIRKLMPGTNLPPRIRPADAIFGRDVDPITRFEAEDFKLYLHDDVLTKVDRMSMANSLEVRVPLLDHVLVELAFSMPIDLKLRECSGKVRSKHLLKRSAERFFSRDFLDRPKWGFGVPIMEWCSGPLLPVLRERLGDRHNPIYSLLDYEAVEQILQPLFSGSGGDPGKAWSLLMLDFWFAEVHLRPANGPS